MFQKQKENHWNEGATDTKRMTSSTQLRLFNWSYTQAETIEFSYVNTGERNIEEKFHSVQVESYPTSLTETPK